MQGSACLSSTKQGSDQGSSKHTVGQLLRMMMAFTIMQQGAGSSMSDPGEGGRSSRRPAGTGLQEGLTPAPHTTAAAAAAAAICVELMDMLTLSGRQVLAAAGIWQRPLTGGFHASQELHN
jgi:hypothetical protein